MRKQLSLVFLLVAYVILLGHSIIPHHHHSTHSDAIAHHETHHTNEANLDVSELGHLLSHFLHSFDVFTNKGHQYTLHFSLRNSPIILAIIPDAFSFYVDEEFSIQNKPLSSDFLFDSSYPNIRGLRGPPSIIA